jgi:hypothetical protein
MRATYVTAATIVGMSWSPEKSSTFGHCWAALLRREGEFDGALHIEPTSPMVVVPPGQDITSLAWQARWKHVYDADTYAKRKRLAHALMKEQGVTGNLLVGARIATTTYYHEPLTATTKAAHYEWPASNNVRWLDVIAAGNNIKPPCALPKYGQPPTDVHHAPDRTQHFPTMYNRVDASTPPVTDYGLDWVGVVYAPLDQPPPERSSIVDSFTIMQYVS